VKAVDVLKGRKVELRVPTNFNEVGFILKSFSESWTEKNQEQQ
jgi:hypothetical protein